MNHHFVACPHCHTNLDKAWARKMTEIVNKTTAFETHYKEKLKQMRKNAKLLFGFLLALSTILMWLFMGIWLIELTASKGIVVLAILAVSFFFIGRSILFYRTREEEELWSNFSNEWERSKSARS